MKRAAIITLAGMSSRFSKSVGHECHKSLYTEASGGLCLLDWQLALLKRRGFSQIVLVGGYRYEDLERHVRVAGQSDSIVLVYNEHYSDLGSCYSLCLGVDAVDEDSESVVFLEGDLMFDDATFCELVSMPGDAITATRSIVDARTSVAFYISSKGRLGYVYDTKHASLQISEPFVRVGNSGQVWQFADVRRLKRSAQAMTERDWAGTNLIPILDYYVDADGTSVRICQFNAWFNCNTVDDYRAMEKYAKESTHGRNQQQA